jgi:hypothetical protein
VTQGIARTPSRVNIAFTSDATAAARHLCDLFPFEDLKDVARVGAAYALRAGMPLTRPSDFGPTSGSNFNIGTVDPQGELRDLLGALHPENNEDPYRVIETLMSVGTIRIAAQVDEGEIRTLRDLIEAS